LGFKDAFRIQVIPTIVMKSIQKMKMLEKFVKIVTVLAMCIIDVVTAMDLELIRHINPILPKKLAPLVMERAK
jgi:hypothetical protein